MLHESLAKRFLDNGETEQKIDYTVFKVKQ